MKFLICTSSGIEAVTKRELERMGIENPKAIDGKIEVEGDFDLLAKLSVNLRTADRILVKLLEFKATTFDSLFDNVSKINWATWLKKDARVLMNGQCVNSKLMAIKVSGSVIKKAIMKNLEKSYKSHLDESGKNMSVYFSIVNDICTISLDASGMGLHKRGYRELTYTAPLKETLAAAMIDLSVFHKEKYFCDLFCGSGTIAIEACLIAKNIAPGKSRHFAFENFANYKVGSLEKAQREAKENELDIIPKIYACDINEEAIKMAKENARKAGVEKFIKFEVADMRNFETDEKFGVVISNVPYGERISTRDEAKILLKDYFKMMKNNPTFSSYILTDDKELEREINRKADKKRKLYNAKIECVYYSFMGEKPEKKKSV